MAISAWSLRSSSSSSSSSTVALDLPLTVRVRGRWVSFLHLGMYSKGVDGDRRGGGTRSRDFIKLGLSGKERDGRAYRKPIKGAWFPQCERNSPSPTGPLGSTGTVPVFNIFSSRSSCSIFASSSSSSPSSIGSPVCGPLAIALPISSASAFCSVRSSLYL